MYIPIYVSICMYEIYIHTYNNYCINYRILVISIIVVRRKQIVLVTFSQHKRSTAVPSKVQGVMYTCTTLLFRLVLLDFCILRLCYE